MEIRNIDIDGRKIITLQNSTKATMQNTASDQKTITFLDRKYMVKSSHQERIVTKPRKEKNIPEVKTTIILSGDKYIAIYHPSANIAPYSAQATRSYLFW